MSYYRKPVCGATSEQWCSTPGPTGHNDPGDPNRPFFVRDQIGPKHFEDNYNGILLAKKGGIARPSKVKKAGKAKIEELYLYDASSNFKDEAIMAREVFKIKDRNALKPVKNWKELANNINQFSGIGQLVLSFHGYGGGLNIGNNVRDLDQKSVKSLFKKTKDSATPKITEIHFNGCNIGNRPTKLVVFANMFSAKKVTAYTWFLVHQRITVRPSGADIESIRNELKPYRKYIIPPLTDASLSLKRKINFLVIYGSEAYEHAKFPLSLGDARKFKPLSEATDKKISNKETDSLEKELDSSPVSSFKRIILSFP